MRGWSVVFGAGLLLGLGYVQAGALAPGEVANLLTDPVALAPIPATANESDVTPGGRVVSDNGRYVTFTSGADALVADDDDRVTNVYRRDLVTGTTILVSRGPGLAGPAATSGSFTPSISADGDRIAFRTSAVLDAADTNNRADIYVRVVSTGETRLVSRAAGASGVVGNDQSSVPEISGNGTYVVFQSSATNLHPDDTDTFQDIFRRNINTNALALVSRRDSDDAKAAQGGSAPSISDDGSRVAFVSASDLAGGSDGGFADAFVRDIPGSSTEAVSLTDGDADVAGAVADPSIAPDGGTVAFASSSDGLDPLDTDANDDIFLRDLAADSTLLISRSAGDDCEGFCRQPIVTEVAGIDRVTYRAIESPSIAGTGQNVAVQRTVLSVTHSVVSRADGATGLIVTPDDFGAARDGTHIAFSTTTPGASGEDSNDFSSVFLRETVAGSTTLVSRLPAGVDATRAHGFSYAESQGGGPIITPDGRFAVIISEADALLPPGSEGTRVETQAYRRDLRTGAFELVSRFDGPVSAPVPGEVVDAAISADGRFVAFTAESQPLAAAFGAADEDHVYRRDLDTGTTILVSRNDGPAGPPAANGAEVADGIGISADGNRVAFVSNSPGIAPGQVNAVRHVVVRDIAAGSTILTSRANGADGANLGGSSDEPAISADGTRVAFTTTTDDLDGDGGTVDPIQVVLRDLSAGTLSVASRAPGGALGNGTSEDPTISADGSRIAYSSEATNLDGADATPADTAYVHDVATGLSQAVGRATGADGAIDPLEQSRVRLSPDGRHVLFTTDSALDPADTNAESDAYLRDTTAGTTARVSLGAGGAQLEAANGSEVSGDARCVMFETEDGAIQAGSPTSGDFRLVAVRAVTADCPVPPPPAPGPSTPPPAVDTTRPVLTNVSLTKKRFRVAGVRVRPLPGRRLAPAGSVLRLRLSEPARVRLVFERRAKGKRVNRRCLAPTRARAKRPNCIRFIRAGVLTRPTLAAGARRIPITGKIGRRALRPGAYRLSVTAIDAAGNRSAVRRVSFTIVRR